MAQIESFGSVKIRRAVEDGPSFTTRGDMAGIKVDKDYFLDADGNLTNDEAKGQRLVAQKGWVISKEKAKQYGIADEPKGEAGDLDTTDGEAKEVKKTKPSANKAKSPKENK